MAAPRGPGHRVQIRSKEIDPGNRQAGPSQAGRRGFESRLPLHFFDSLQPITKSDLTAFTASSFPSPDQSSFHDLRPFFEIPRAALVAERLRIRALPTYLPLILENSGAFSREGAPAIPAGRFSYATALTAGRLSAAQIQAT